MKLIARQLFSSQNRTSLQGSFSFPDSSPRTPVPTGTPSSCAGLTDGW